MTPERNGNGIPLREWVERLQSDNEKQRQKAWETLNDLEARVRDLERGAAEGTGAWKTKRRLYAVGAALATIFIAAVSLIVNIIQGSIG